MNIESDFTSNILNGEFKKAKLLSKELSFNRLDELLMKLAFDNQNILSYVFINYLIAEKETAEYHSLASDILGSPLCSLNGAYKGSLFHARRALGLDPDNILYKEWILFFYEIPDRLVSREEAEKIALEILEENPSNWAAKKIFE